MQEFETSKLMRSLLEKAGFEIQRNLSGMPTGFLATYGSGKPVIALHTEFDATPACSQKAGVTEPMPIVDGAPGHTDGHNVNGAVMVGAAFAIKKAMDRFNLEGTLTVFGAPAEEQSTYYRCTPSLVDFSRASPLNLFEQPARDFFQQLAGLAGAKFCSVGR